MNREIDSIFKLKDGITLKVFESHSYCFGCYFYDCGQCKRIFNEQREYIGGCTGQIFVEIPNPKFKFLQK